MQVKVLTLPFRAELGQFDDTALTEYAGQHDLLSCHERLFFVEAQPYLVCVLTSRSAAVSPTNTKTRAAPARSRAPSPEVEEVHRPLFEELRQWRKERAQTDGVPPYTILTNQSLLCIVRQRPSTKTQLLEIPGLGEQKLARFGADLLRRIAGDEQ